ARLGARRNDARTHPRERRHLRSERPGRARARRLLDRRGHHGPHARGVGAFAPPAHLAARPAAHDAACRGGDRHRVDRSAQPARRARRARAAVTGTHLRPAAARARACGHAGARTARGASVGARCVRRATRASAPRRPSAGARSRRSPRPLQREGTPPCGRHRALRLAAESGLNMAAKRKAKAREAQLAFEALSIEGGLLSPEWLSKVAQLQAGTQAEADYRIHKGLNLRDEIGRYWRIAQAHWADVALLRARSHEYTSGQEANDVAKAASERFVLALLRDALGFTALVPVEPAILQERAYPIGHATLGGRVPVVIAPADSGLDTLSPAFG